MPCRTTVAVSFVTIYPDMTNHVAYHDQVAIVQCVRLSTLLPTDSFRPGAAGLFVERLSSEPFEQRRLPNSIVTQ